MAANCMMYCLFLIYSAITAMGALIHHKKCMATKSKMCNKSVLVWACHMQTQIDTIKKNGNARNQMATETILGTKALK